MAEEPEVEMPEEAIDVEVDEMTPPEDPESGHKTSGAAYDDDVNVSVRRRSTVKSMIEIDKTTVDQWDEILVYGAGKEELNGTYTRLEGSQKRGGVGRKHFVYVRQLEDEAESNEKDRFYLFHCKMEIPGVDSPEPLEDVWKITNLTPDEAEKRPHKFFYYSLSDALNPAPVGWKEFDSKEFPIKVDEADGGYRVTRSVKKMNGLYEPREEKGIADLGEEGMVPVYRCRTKKAKFWMYKITVTLKKRGEVTCWQITRKKRSKAYNTPNAYIYRNYSESDTPPEEGWVEMETVHARRPCPVVEPRTWNECYVNFGGRDEVNGRYEKIYCDYERSRRTKAAYYREDLNEGFLKLDLRTFYFRQDKAPHHIIYKLDKKIKNKVAWVLATEDMKQRIYLATMPKKKAEKLNYPPTFGWECNPYLLEQEEEEESEDSIDDATEDLEAGSESESEDEGELKQDDTHPDWPAPTISNMQEKFIPEYCLTFRVRNFGYHLVLNRNTIDMVVNEDEFKVDEDGVEREMTEEEREEKTKETFAYIDDEKKWPTRPGDIMRCIKNARLQYQLKLSSDGEHIFCFVAVDAAASKRWASYMDHDLLLDAENAIKIGRQEVNMLLAKRTVLADESEEQVGLDFLLDGAKEVIDWFLDRFCCGVVGKTIDALKCILRCIFCGFDWDFENYFYSKGVVNEDKWLNVYVQYTEMVREEVYTRYRVDTSNASGKDPESSKIKLNEPDYDDGSIFSQRHRLRVIYEMLVGEVMFDPSLPSGAQIRVEEFSLDMYNPLDGAFPLHDNDLKNELFEDFGVMGIMTCSTEQFEETLNEIRNYYGEEIAFYFAFLRKYNIALYIPVFGGVVAFIFQMARGDKVGINGISFFALFLILWSVIFVEFWHGVERELSSDWGMTRFSRKAVPRPQFKGQKVVSDITGKVVEEHRVPAFYYCCLGVSYTTVFLFIMMVVATVTGLYIWRLNMPCGSLGYSILIGSLNAVAIQVWNVIYAQVSFVLNERENHRLQAEYDKSMVWKKILFYMINSYISLFFIAFLPRPDTNCAEGDTASEDDEAILSELRLQLASLFITAIFVQNVLEMYMNPIFDYVFTALGWVVPEYDLDSIQHVEVTQYAMPPGTLLDADEQVAQYPSPELLDQMAEIVIQYGYVTFFIIVFPITPLLALINNFAEIYVDTKSWRETRRPIPKGATGIGEWNAVLSLFSLIAVITNIALVSFHTDNVKEMFNTDSDDQTTTAYFFFGLCAIIYFCIVIIRFLNIGECFVGGFVEDHLARSNEIEKNLVAKAYKQALFTDQNQTVQRAPASLWQEGDFETMHFSDGLTKYLAAQKMGVNVDELNLDSKRSPEFASDPLEA